MMTLGNMRDQGVRSLTAHCFICHHAAIVSVKDATWPINITPTF